MLVNAMQKGLFVVRVRFGISYKWKKRLYLRIDTLDTVRRNEDEHGVEEVDTGDSNEIDQRIV
jgi:hypothetical protein